MVVNKVKNKVIFFLLFILASLSVFVVFIYTNIFNFNLTVPNPTKNALYLDSAQPIEVRVADLLSYMTLEEKIGQMALVEKDSIKELGDIKDFHLGALLSGSGSKPEKNTSEGWKEMIDTYQAEAKLSRLSIPLLYGSDAIHGHAHVPEATVFPHALGLGATNNPKLVEEIAKATAEELVATGVNWNFAPNLDQPQDIRWGRTYEAFSDDSKLVSKLGVAYLRGLQKPPEGKIGNVFVLATPKHYLGLGGMEWNTSLNKNFKIDQGVTVIDETLLRTVYLPPFAETVNAGALSVMVGLNTWGDKKMVLQKYLLTDVLKQELNFKGFVVSDWYGVYEGRKDNFLATISAVNAGVDMVMLPFDYKTFTRHMWWANKLGLVSDERLNDAVFRILYAKFSLGLFDTKENFVTIDIDVSNSKHRALAREAVAESLVLLKNQGSVLPLKTNVKYIRVAGSSADNVGMQMGGWSLEWQGVDGNWPVGATSILSGIKARVDQDVKVEFDRLGNFSDNGIISDVGIVVVGEKPYSEGWGDKEYPVLSEEDLLAIKNLKATSNKVIVVIVSGRPLFITNEINSFDGLVMAWLPGSEGMGVADVLFGDKPFKGSLPLPWPSQSEQLPIKYAGNTVNNNQVLFPRYFGLKNSE